MSRWTHAICAGCWQTYFGGPAEPVRLKDPDDERCCYCGRRTQSGIYVRADPSTLECQGAHAND